MNTYKYIEDMLAAGDMWSVVADLRIAVTFYDTHRYRRTTHTLDLFVRANPLRIRFAPEEAAEWKSLADAVANCDDDSLLSMHDRVVAFWNAYKGWQ